MLNKIFESIPENGITPAELRRKIGVRSQREIYAEIALLVYLDKIERRGRGKNLRYMKKSNELNLLVSLLSKDEPLKAYSFVLAKRKTRKEVTNWVYGNTASTNLSRITAMMKLGRLLDLVITYGGYKVKKDKAVKLFERLLEEIYFKKVKESGLEIVDLGTLRNEIKKFVPDMDKKMFDELILELSKSREDLKLFPAPAVDDNILRDGIQTSEGVLYHLKLDSSRWGLK